MQVSNITQTITPPPSSTIFSGGKGSSQTSLSSDQISLGTSKNPQGTYNPSLAGKAGNTKAFDRSVEKLPESIKKNVTDVLDLIRAHSPHSLDFFRSLYRKFVSERTSPGIEKFLSKIKKLVNSADQAGAGGTVGKVLRGASRNNAKAASKIIDAAARVFQSAPQRPQKSVQLNSQQKTYSSPDATQGNIARFIDHFVSADEAAEVSKAVENLGGEKGNKEIQRLVSVTKDISNFSSKDQRGLFRLIGRSGSNASKALKASRDAVDLGGLSGRRALTSLFEGKSADSVQKDISGQVNAQALQSTRQSQGINSVLSSF